MDKGTNRSRADGSSQTQGEYYREDHTGGRDVSSSDGTYAREGAFSRNEAFSENRSASEKYFEHARSLDRQAARMDEVGKRLEQIATYTETHGYQLSEDMSQYVASRYYEMTSGPYRGLGAPSLLDTNPTGAQRAARDLIVGRILDDYVRADLERVETGLIDPAESVRPISAPPIWSPEQLQGGLPDHAGGMGHSAARSGSAGIRQELAQGAGELDRVKARQEDTFAEGVRGTQGLHEEHARRTDKAWFDGE